MKKILFILCLLVIGALAYVHLSYGGDIEDRPVVDRGAVSTGDILQIVRAVGTLQPIRLVQVGAQVSGEIVRLNADFNSVVKKDEILAQLDSSLYDVQVSVQEANIARQDSDLAGLRVQLATQQRAAARLRAELGKGLVSPQEVEKAVLAVKTLQAQITSGEKARVQAEAQLEQAKLNVSYCTIRSPINGVVVSRLVDVGQTLQSRMNAPTLFTIAADMTTLRLQAGVDEADIGLIRAGMPVTFTVDAYRGRTFTGRVDAVRLNAQISNNVVTYPVWIEVSNTDLKLRPSMTANLQIAVASARHVARIPADALAFRATSEMFSWLGLPPPEIRAARIDAVETVEPSEAPRRPRRGDQEQIDDLWAPVPKKITPGIVWVYDKNETDPAKTLRPVKVRVGVSDGQFAELVSGDLRPGDQLVTAIEPPPSVLRAMRAATPFGRQRGSRGMTRGGPTALPTLRRGR